MKADIVKRTLTIEDLISNIVEEVELGNANPLEVFVALKRLADVSATANKKLLSQAIDEADKQHKNGTVPFNQYGKTIQVVNSGGRWDFKHLPVIVDVEKRLKGLQELAKNAQKTGVEVADTETGEVIGAGIPPLSTTTIRITDSK